MNTFESHIFTFETATPIGHRKVVYNNCTLITDFGEFKEGEKVDLIVVNMRESQMEVVGGPGYPSISDLSSSTPEP